MQFIIFIIIAALTVAFDLVVKFFTAEYLQPLGSVSLLDGVFSLTYVENRGAAFGIMQNKQYIFIIFTAVVLALIVIYLLKKKPQGKLPYYSLAFVAGGAIGNLVDRIFRGYVVDLFDFELINFPVFNVADIFVCVGAVLTAIYILLDKEE